MATRMPTRKANGRSTASADRPTARKRYEWVADVLIGEIQSGTLAVGATLPGELELVARFAVSRHTVREALRRLEGLGLIGRHQGIGTVVRAREPQQSYVQSVRSPEELLRYPPESRLVVQSVESVKANRRLARLIGCPVGSQWVRISAVRRIRQTHLPICHVDLYLLPEFAGVAEFMGRRTQPVYEMIEREFGHRVADVKVEIRAGLIPEALAGLLEVPPGSPSLQVVRRYCGEDRKVFEVSVSEHPAERYTYSIQLRRGWQSGSGGSGSWTT